MINNKFTKKVLTSIVTGTTIIWSVGIGTLVPFLPVHALSIVTAQSQPQNGATNVPPDASVHLTLDANLDMATITPGRISFVQTSNSSAFPYSLRAFPNGFDIVPSLPPVFANGSSFSRLHGSYARAFFNIVSGQSINPAGDYTVPSVGDFVFYQRDTFPPEFGMVTNNGLTGGTFAINGFPIIGGYDIVRFGNTPGNTDVTTDNAGAALQVGDVIFTYPTTNPTASAYGWHIITADNAGATAIANANLRLDGATNQPGFFAGSRYSELGNSGSTRVNGANEVQGLTYPLNMTVGSLIFANVTMNADNTGTYAWHTVTTPQNFTTDTAPSGLRLDNNTGGAPVFAANSKIAFFTPNAFGPVTGATSLATGDIVFAKATAGAAGLGTYGFHMVTAGANVNSPNLRLDNTPAQLLPNTNYTVTVTGGADGITAGGGANTITGNYTMNFTTANTSATNNTSPIIQMSNPQPGNQSFPTNAPVTVQFSVAMSTTGGSTGTNSVTNPSVVGVFADTSGVAASTPLSSTNSWDGPTRTVTLSGLTLTANTNYILKVSTAAQSSTGAAFMQEYRASFRTSAGTDSTRPTITGTFPSSAATGVTRTLPDITVGFSEAMQASTISATTISFSPAITGTVTYDAVARTAHFTPSQILGANTTYTGTLVGTGGTPITDLSLNALNGNTATPEADDYTWTFTTANSYSATEDDAPTITSAAADNFGLSVTFSHPMRATGDAQSANSIQNYALESPVGTTISLAGKTIAWNGALMTANITGLSLMNGNTFKLTVNTLVQSLYGTNIDTTGTPARNTMYATVQNATTTGGLLGPGTGPAPDPTQMGMNPTRVSPIAKGAGLTSNYVFELPVTTSVPSGGSVSLTFPLGFIVSGATAATGSPRNSDLNGPMAGTVTISTVTVSGQTITVTTAGAATGNNSFLSFELSGIVNSTTPSPTGYTVDIKTKDTPASNSAILETKTSAAFFLGQAGSITLTVQVFDDNGTGGGTAGNKTREGGEPWVQDARLFLFSPAQGGQAASTNAGGTATFSNLSAGTYELMLKPDSLLGASAATTFITPNTAPQRINLSVNQTVTYPLRNAGDATSGIVTISGTITAPAGLNGTSIDVFAASPFGFVKRTVVLATGANAYSIPVNPNTTYNVGIGPTMPEAFLQPGAPPPPPPTFTFMPPPPLEVIVSAANVTGQNVTLAATDRTITVNVRDSAGNAVNGVMVFARPANASVTEEMSSIGMGTGAQTGRDGVARLSVIAGLYVVGVFKPGMPPAPDQEVTVPSGSDPAALTFTLVTNTATALTISGTVKDDSGNAIPYAGVHGRRVTSAADTTAIGGGMDFVGGPTDANGGYTLYVPASTVWVLEAFAPGVGKLGSKTITVGTSSVTGQDFSAETMNLATISGSATRGGVAQQGIHVRVQGPSGENFTVTDADGNYSVKVPTASGYTVSCFFPGFGDATPLTSIAAPSASNTCTMATTITITVTITNGTTPIQNAFVDVRDANGRGNGTNVSTTSGVNAVYTVSVPAGTYTVTAGHPAYGPIGRTANVSATGTVPYTATSGATVAVTGTVTSSSVALANAWVSLSGTPSGRTNNISIGGLSGANGVVTINIPPGTYQLRVDKPGYRYLNPPTFTISATQNLGTFAMEALTGGYTISGTITLPASAGGGAAALAFVDASDGQGGFVVTQADSTGAYTLNVGTGSTWSLRTHGAGYEGALSVTVSGASRTGQNVTLAAISGYTIRPEKPETMTPTSGGFLTNTDIGAGFKVNFPANALGTSSNASTVTTKRTTATPFPPTGTYLAKNAVEITATDSAGSLIKSLNDAATVVIPYTEADLPAGTSEANLTLAKWNTTTNSYNTLPSTVDTENNTITTTTTTLSLFVPMLFSAAQSTGGRRDPTPPAAPTALKATSDGSSVTLTWKDPSDTDLGLLEVLRNDGGTGNVSGTPLYTVAKGVQTYKDTSVVAGKTYKYQVRSVDSASNFTNSEIVPIEVKTAAVATAPVAPTPTTPTTPTTPAPTQPVTPPPATTPPAPTAAADRAQQIQKIVAEAKQLLSEAKSKLAELVGKTLDTKVEQQAAKLLAKVVSKALKAEAREKVSNFIAYGTPTALSLGSGERAGVVNSFRAALGKDPVTEEDWSDVLKIAVGRFPTQTNATREQAVEASFEKVYKRAPDRSNTNDNAAITIMAYGLRTARNLATERAAIGHFRSIFKKAPFTASDWDIVRAIGYSGATR